MTKTVMQCDRCGAGPAGADQFDQCDLCGQTLCDECMAAGCCGQVPAERRRGSAISEHGADQKPHRIK